MTSRMEIQFSLCAFFQQADEWLREWKFNFLCAFFQQAADCHQMGAVFLLHGGREPDESDQGRGKARVSAQENSVASPVNNRGGVKLGRQNSVASPVNNRGGGISSWTLLTYFYNLH